jgi:hypothetical protein
MCQHILKSRLAVLTTLCETRNLRMIEAIAGPRPKTRADLVRLGILGELGYKAANVHRL